MLDPENITRVYAEIESDLYRFRSFLRSHADIDKLDAQFLALHNELFAEYDCSQCKNCCKKIRPLLKSRKFCLLLSSQVCLKLSSKLSIYRKAMAN